MSTIQKFPVKPQSAWVLMGDEISYPILDDDVEYGVTSQSNWTCCPHIEIGDTLFFYFMNPLKEVHFIGRAVSLPYVDSSIGVATLKDVHNHQWWVDYDCLVKIEPISFKCLNEIMGGHLVLRGRNGKCIRPEAANRLLKQSHAIDSFKAVHKRMALQPINGRNNLPSPKDIDLNAWKSINTSDLRLESNVEEFIVEPLFRLLNLPKSYSLQFRFSIGMKVADYVILYNDVPHCIIECKLRARFGRKRVWSASPDVVQARRYADAFKIPYIVIDSSEIFFFRHKKIRPLLTVSRRNSRRSEIQKIRDLIVSGT